MSGLTPVQKHSEKGETQTDPRISKFVSGVGELVGTSWTQVAAHAGTRSAMTEISYPLTQSESLLTVHASGVQHWLQALLSANSGPPPSRSPGATFVTARQAAGQAR